MSTLHVLIAARAWLSIPQHWTQHAFAKDSLGNVCAPKQGVCHCMAGAVQFVSDEAYKSQEAKSALDELGRVVNNIPEFNDQPDRTHQEVLEAFDTAIARLTCIKK